MIQFCINYFAVNIAFDNYILSVPFFMAIAAYLSNINMAGMTVHLAPGILPIFINGSLIMALAANGVVITGIAVGPSHAGIEEFCNLSGDIACQPGAAF